MECDFGISHNIFNYVYRFPDIIDWKHINVNLQRNICWCLFKMRHLKMEKSFDILIRICFIQIYQSSLCKASTKTVQFLIHDWPWNTQTDNTPFYILVWLFHPLFYRFKWVSRIISGWGSEGKEKSERGMREKIEEASRREHSLWRTWGPARAIHLFSKHSVREITSNI